MKVDHQIFYLIKYIQEMHLILKCLLLSQMNRDRKEEVWQMQIHKKAKHLWLFLIHHSGGVFFHLWSWGNGIKIDTLFSISYPQLQIGLSESRRPCLNLRSWRWLNSRRSLVRYLIPLVLKQLYVLLGEVLMSFKIHF